MVLVPDLENDSLCPPGVASTDSHFFPVDLKDVLARFQLMACHFLWVPECVVRVCLGGRAADSAYMFILMAS